MKFEQTIEFCYGIRYSKKVRGKEIARARLFILYNDLHDRPFGFLEDVFVYESARGQGIATTMCKRIIADARKRKCYKIVATSRYSRPHVHKIYESLGYRDHGKEFRIDL